MSDGNALEVVEAELLAEEQREREKGQRARASFEEADGNVVREGAKYVLAFMSVMLGIMVLALVGVIVLVWWLLGDFLIVLFRDYQLGALLVAALAAGLLFRLRSTRPIIYGALEIAVGLIAAYYAFAQFAPTLEKALPIAAAIYIMIRGLDNFSKGIGRKTASKKTWLRIIFPQN